MRTLITECFLLGGVVLYSEFHFESVASIVLRYLVVPFDGELEIVSKCMWRPQLWSLTRLLVACLFILRHEV